MPDPLTGTAALAAAAAYIAKTGYEYVLKMKNGSNEEHRRCKAQDIQSDMQSALNAQTRLLEGIDRNSRETRDGVNKLVTITERNGR